MGVTRPLVSEIAYQTYLINEFGMATSFLLLGDKRGLVIDAGCGMYNLKEIYDEYCHLPYDVAITHGHCDHFACAGEFEEVWIHKADIPEANDLERTARMLGEYPEMMALHGTFDTYDIAGKQCCFRGKLPKWLPMGEGHIFDLGNRKVEVIHTPGHSVGECVFLDFNSRIVFTGDACNPNLGIHAASINTALGGLLKLKKREHEFDRNFNSHAGYGGNTDNISMPASCLDDCIKIMSDILHGTAEVQHETSPYRPGSKPVTFVKYGAVMVHYDPERIIDDGEQAIV